MILSWSQMVVALCAKMDSTEHIFWLVGGVILHLGTASYILFSVHCVTREPTFCAEDVHIRKGGLHGELFITISAI